MKKLFWKQLRITNTLLLASSSIACLSFVTSCQEATPSYWTDLQKETIGGIQQLDERLMLVDYKADVKINETIDNNQETYVRTSKCIHDAILPESPYCMPENFKPMPKLGISSEGACTSFAIPGNEGTNILGKNYDWLVDETFGVIIKNEAPDVKYKSFGITSSLFLSLENGWQHNIENKERFLYAPMFILEGMNEKGLTINTLMLHSGGNNMNQCEPGKKALCSKYLPQTVLSNCANVQEAVELMHSYNLRSFDNKDDQTSNSHQWVIADQNNRMLVTYICNEMVTYSNFSETERSKMKGGLEHNKPFRVCNIEFQELPESEYDKNPATHPDAWRYGSALLPKTDAERITIKDKKDDYLFATNFYENILDNEMKYNAQPKTIYKYQGEERIFYDCGDNGFCRYCICREELKKYDDPSKSKPTVEDAMNILKACAYRPNDGDILAVRWKYQYPFKNLEDRIGITIFSLVFDTKNLKINLCTYENFDKVYSFNFN